MTGVGQHARDFGAKALVSRNQKDVRHSIRKVLSATLTELMV